MAGTEKKKAAEKLNSSEKTVYLLCLLGQAPYKHGVTELGEKIGCSKSGTFKLLAALTQKGLASQTQDHKYTLGPMAYILGKTYEDHIGLSKMARPYLRRLSDLTGENASFSMLINGRACLIYREESVQVVRVVGKPGQERPLYCGATGKILGAFQDPETIRKRLMEEPMTAFTERTITAPEALLEEYARIRKQGYSYSDREMNNETVGIGAPVYDPSGKVWAAISVGVPYMRMDEAKKARYIYLVKETARDMSENLAEGRLPDE